MIEELCQEFVENPSHKIAHSLLKKLYDNREYNTCLIMSSRFILLFPKHYDINLYHARALKQLKQYQSSLEAYDKCFDLCKVSTERISLLRKERSECISNVKHIYETYPSYIVEQIKSRSISDFPQITLSITSCKRLDLFTRTMNSFLNCCTDLDLIDRWICVDDNSSEQDRQEMKRLYPFFEFVFKKPTEKGHSISMNIIHNTIKTPYLLHLEDDWTFFAKHPFISNCLNIIRDNDKVGQCLFNYNYSETEDQDITGGQLTINNTGDNFIVHKHAKIGTTEYNNLVKDLKQNCVYWPHFSFRPSLLKTSVLKEIGQYNENSPHFELEYAERYTSHGYSSVFLNRIFCLHTGKLTFESQTVKKNAYALNGVPQFETNAKTKQEEKQKERQEEGTPPKSASNLWCRVVNLRRRQDRWDSMEEQLKSRLRLIPFSRFDAVEGTDIINSRKLQCLFAPNDYRMRRGIVGCALSHIKLLKDCVKHNNTVIILEDDVELVDDFESQVLKLVEKMKQTEWDLIYLGHTLRPGVKQPENAGCFKRNTRDSIRYSLGGTGGYIVNCKGAKRLLDFIEKNGMTNAIDTVQQLFSDHGNVFYLNPCIVLFEVNTDTDIQKNFDTTLELDEKSAMLQEAIVWDKWGIDSEKILVSDTPFNDAAYHTYQLKKNIYINVPLDLVTDENREDILLSRL
jgi:GR25 family glycosyltransferase involved in LPS biosynthesis